MGDELDIREIKALRRCHWRGDGRVSSLHHMDEIFFCSLPRADSDKSTHKLSHLMPKKGFRREANCEINYTSSITNTINSREETGKMKSTLKEDLLVPR